MNSVSAIKHRDLITVENVIGNTPVIGNPVPVGAGDSGGMAGLNCSVLTSALSPQCGGIAGVLMPYAKWP